MSRVIVTSTYRYKHPPRKRKAVALEVSAIITRARPRKSVTVVTDLERAEPVQNAQSAPAITTRRKAGRFGNAPYMTPEEHQRRGDAADALFRQIVRRAAGKEP